MADKGLAGNRWNWIYKDAISVNSKIPTFTLQGRRGWFSRATLSSTSPQVQNCCLVFFPKADHNTDQFAGNLSASFKTALVMGKWRNNIHLIITCNNLEEFDKHTKHMASNVNAWADINGEVAEKFGMRPLTATISLGDIFSSGKEEKRSYAKETIIGMIFVFNYTIVKSPAFQPKLQVANVDTLKSVLEDIEKANGDLQKMTSNQSYAGPMSESELQLKHKRDWEIYEKEYQQMMEDLNQKPPKAPKKTDKQKTVKKKSPTKSPVKKKTKTVKRTTKPKKTGKKTVKKSMSKRLNPDGTIKSRL